jgi:hypothetical protein
MLRGFFDGTCMGVAWFIGYGQFNPLFFLALLVMWSVVSTIIEHGEQDE